MSAIGDWNEQACVDPMLSIAIHEGWSRRWSHAGRLADYVATYFATYLRDVGARMQAEVTVLGMGLGRSASTATLVRSLAEVGSAHFVFDADALHALGPHAGRLDGGTRFVLTPHEAEAAHLLGVGANHVRSDRERAALLLAERTGATIVLKGPHTLVTDGTRHWRAGPGHPVLATGGTGDVLAGAIGAFLAAAVRAETDRFDAICSAVHVHALAGERRARGHVDRGVLASEIADEIPHALAAWRSEATA